MRNHHKISHKWYKSSLTAALRNAILSVIVLTIGIMLVPNRAVAQPWGVDLINIPVDRETSVIAKHTRLVEAGYPAEFIFNLQQTPLCYDRDTCDAWMPWVLKRAIIIVHPGFPDCQFFITYKTRICSTNTNKIQVYIMSVAILNPNSQCCQDLFWYFRPYGWQGETVNIEKILSNQLIHDLYGVISKYNFLQANSTIGTLYCDQYLHKRISYYKGTCQGWCKIAFEFPEEEGGASGSVWIPKYCNITNCCKVENTFCIDRVTGKLKHFETLTPDTLSIECATTKPITEPDCIGIWENTGYYPYIYDVQVTPCDTTTCRSCKRYLGD